MSQDFCLLKHASINITGKYFSKVLFYATFIQYLELNKCMQVFQHVTIHCLSYDTTMTQKNSANIFKSRRNNELDLKIEYQLLKKCF